jgi:ketosteroid isomerase-like protein
MSDNDADALLTFYAEDWVALPPDGPAQSDPAVLEEGMRSFFANNDYMLEEATVEDIKASGDLAVVRVHFRDRFAPKTGGLETAQSGQWIVIWERQADGAWKIGADMWNREQPALEMPTALKSHHLFNLSEGTSEADFAELLGGMNAAVAEAGFPGFGYRLWKVEGEQTGEYAYLWEGYWPGQEGYDSIHEHPAYQAAIEQWGPAFEAAVADQVYNRYSAIPAGAGG